MSEELIRICALFYFLITLDDKIAKEATTKTLKLLKHQIKNQKKLKKLTDSKTQNSPVEYNSADRSEDKSEDIETLLKLCLSEWKRIRLRFRKEQIQIINTQSLLWPEHIDLNPWKEFQKNASENELIAVTFVHILGVTEGQLARCLNQSEGTIRYRVGKGLGLLGQLNRPNLSALQFS